MQTEPLRTVAGTAPHTLVVSVARSEIERCRRAIANGESSVPGAEELAANAVSELERLGRPSQRRVINATGVVLHTNLGRAPLARGAIEAVELVAAGYTNLEYDLDAGERGSRNAHVDALLCELTGAEAAIAVNNNAAAVVLTLAALARGRSLCVQGVGAGTRRRAAGDPRRATPLHRPRVGPERRHRARRQGATCVDAG